MNATRPRPRPSSYTLIGFGIAMIILATLLDSKACAQYYVDTYIDGEMQVSKPLTVKLDITALVDEHTNSLLCGLSVGDAHFCSSRLTSGDVVTFPVEVAVPAMPFALGLACQAWSETDCTGISSIKWSDPIAIRSTHTDDDVAQSLMDREGMEWSLRHFLDRWGWGVQMFSVVRAWAREQ